MNRTLSLTMLPLVLLILFQEFARIRSNMEDGHRILELADVVRLLLCALFLLATYIGLRYGRWPKVLSYAFFAGMVGLGLLEYL